MQTKWYRFLLTLFLLPMLLIWATPTAFAQSTSNVQVHVTQVDTSQFPRVTVYVSVVDAAGEPVSVDPNQLQISEGGQAMQAVDVRGGGQGKAEPLTTILLIDISGSMDKNGKLDAAKNAARAYVNQMRPDDQTGIITFDTHVYHPQAVTKDTAALLTAIDGIKTGGDTAMYDALIDAEGALEGVSGRKAIIALTDGLDNHSHNTVDDVINKVGPSGLTISTVGFGDASTASQAGLDENALQSLAQRSGGLYSYASDAKALRALYQQYGRVLQSEYALTYVSPSTLRDGINRNLTVSLSTAVGQVNQTAGYNPGGVLPEVNGSSWRLFGILLVGLLVLLFVPFVIGRGAGIFSNLGRRKGGKIKLTNPTGAGSNTAASRMTGSTKKPRIKIK